MPNSKRDSYSPVDECGVISVSPMTPDKYSAHCGPNPAACFPKTAVESLYISIALRMINSCIDPDNAEDPTKVKYKVWE